MRATRASVVLVVCCTASLAAQEADEQELRGRHFAVHGHGIDERTAEQALQVVEAAWPEAARVLGRSAEPKELLPVHLHRTIAGYVDADRQLSGGKFERNLAMTWWPTREAHVALQPPLGDEALRAIGLPAQTVALLAWEAAHLARSALCPAYASHPQWFVDGFAAHVAGAVLARGEPDRGLEAHPFLATRIVLVRSLLQRRQLPKVADVLADRIDDLDVSDRYAARAIFFAFLAADAKRLQKVVSPVVRAGGGSPRERVAEAVHAALGRNADRDFEKWIASLEPQWEEIYRSLGTGGRHWHQIAFADKNAVAWRLQPSPRGLALRGTLRILPGEGRQLNVLFAREDDGFYSVAFTADHGFTVFDYRPARAEPWQTIGSANAPGLRLGYTSKFAVEASGRRLAVQLDGRSWEFELPRALPDEVRWGLGAQQGTAGLWSEITADPAGTDGR